jgi:hypothetical protein
MYSKTLGMQVTVHSSKAPALRFPIRSSRPPSSQWFAISAFLFPGLGETPDAVIAETRCHSNVSFFVRRWAILATVDDAPVNHDLLRAVVDTANRVCIPMYAHPGLVNKTLLNVQKQVDDDTR